MEELIKQAQDSLYIRIYGTEVFDFPKTDQTVLNDLGFTSGSAKIIRVFAIDYGITTDTCRQVRPYYLVVSGVGKPAECNGSALPEDIKFWVLKKDIISARLDSTIGTINDLTTEDDLEAFGPVDLKVEPRLFIKVTERGNGNICVEYEVSVKAYWRAFGSSWQKFASISEKGSECIQDNACVKVIDSDYINCKLCYHPNDNRICLEGRVGYKGASIKVQKCFSL